MRREQMIAELTPLVPAGRAFRRYQTIINYNRAAHGYHDRPQIEPNDQTIRSGARDILTSTIVNYRSKGHIEIYRDESGEQWLRLGGRA